jgi:hypothetical protein
MRPFALTPLVFALCAGCAQQQGERVQARTARSLLAEWTLLAELQPRLPDSYVRHLRNQAQSELGRVAASANASGNPAGRALAAVTSVQGDPPPALLSERVRAAQAIEFSLEAR